MFFNSHPIYSTMPPNYLGCGVLTNKLTKILFTHIKHNLPEIIVEIREKLKETESDLADLGEPLPQTQSEKMHLLWNMITEFVQTYKNQISGKFDARRKIIESGPVKADLSGGARIKMSFYRLYSEYENFNAT